MNRDLDLMLRWKKRADIAIDSNTYVLTLRLDILDKNGAFRKEPKVIKLKILENDKTFKNGQLVFEDISKEQRKELIAETNLKEALYQLAEAIENE